MTFRKSKPQFPSYIVEKCSLKFNFLTCKTNGLRDQGRQGLMHYAVLHGNVCGPPQAGFQLAQAA